MLIDLLFVVRGIFHKLSLITFGSFVDTCKQNSLNMGKCNAQEPFLFFHILEILIESWN